MTLLAQFAATGGGIPNYIEDVFSTYVYTGTGAALTITNGIDLSTKGGLVWVKDREATGSQIHQLTDSAVGITKYRESATTAGDTTVATQITAFNTNGFSLGTGGNVNQNAEPFASWTFRKQPKFFDIQTWTGTGANRTIAHALGSVPGCIMVKRTDTTGAWQVYHRSLANTEYLVLNTTAAVATGATRWNSTTPTSTEFSLGTDATVNASGGTYVAYIFANDAGGFGLTSSDNVVSCGSYTGTGAAGNPVTLGYEPQWLLIKRATGDIGNWNLFDNMRGFCNASSAATSLLLANTNGADSTGNSVGPTATGFEFGSGAFNNSGSTFIYIAIRRGPMKVPTTGTSVLGLNARTGTGANATVTGSAGVSDAVLVKNRGSAVASLLSSRLTNTGYLVTSSSADEVAAGTTILQTNPWDVMDGVKVGTTSNITNASANTYINYLFDRAPSFFDVVCYTGTGSNTTQTHNLGIAPELWIVKGRNAVGEAWNVGCTALAATERILLEYANAKSTVATMWNSTYPTSTVFSVGTSSGSNGSGYLYVAYLFATCAGVSKVGGYTGTGTTQTINCGFTAGARFVLIKRTDSTGDWYYWDSTRGIIAGNDPYLLLNSTAAEVTGTDYVDTAATGFELSSTAPAAINANGGTYIFLAIA